MTENSPAKDNMNIGPMEEECQIGFWIKGLIGPNEEIVFDDSLLIRGVPTKADTCIYFKFKKKKNEDLDTFADEQGKTLRKIFQIYGLISDSHVEVPTGWCASPITKEIPFGKMKHIFIESEVIADEKTKERYKPLIKKAITKYTCVKDIYENQNKAYLRNAIDYYNRSLKDDSLEEKLIDLMIALESLFSGGGGELALRYSLRIAFLAGNGNEDKRSEIFKLVKGLYGKRSEIVHGISEVKLEYADVSQFKSIINQAIKILVQIKLKKQTVLDLLDEAAVLSETKKQELNQLVLEAINEW
jgi:Apea-like HEPN